MRILGKSLIVLGYILTMVMLGLIGGIINVPFGHEDGVEVTGYVVDIQDYRVSRSIRYRAVIAYLDPDEREHSFFITGGRWYVGQSIIVLVDPLDYSRVIDNSPSWPMIVIIGFLTFFTFLGGRVLVMRSDTNVEDTNPAFSMQKLERSE